MRNTSWNRRMLGLFILALGLRIAYAWYMRQHYFFFDNPSDDVLYYRDWAREIAMGNVIGTRTFYGLPLYAYFLAILERLSLGHLDVVRFWHLLLGSLNCLLVARLARRVFNEPAGLLAGLLAATNFYLIYYDWLLMPVTLLISLNLVIADSLALWKPGSIRESLSIGCLTGLAALGDGKMLIFVLLAAGYLLVKTRPRRDAVQMLVPFLAGVVIMVGGVTVRNKIVGGDWVLISAQSGLSLYAGNNPGATGVYESPEFIRPNHQGQDADQRIIAEAVAGHTLSDGEISAFWRGKARAFMREHPGEWLVVLARKFRLFFTETEYAHDIDLILQRSRRLLLDFNPFLLVCPLGLLGLFLAGRERRPVGWISLLIAGQLAMTVIFFLTTRHRTTILPFLLMGEAYTIYWIADGLLRRPLRAVAVPAAVLAVYLAAFPPEILDAATDGFIYHSKTGLAYEKKGRPAAARPHYRKALELRPQDVNTLYNIGNTYANEKRFSEAEEFYTQALAACHYNVDVLFNLGYVYEQTGRLDQAAESFQSVLQYDPDALDARLRLGEIAVQRGDCPSAKRYWEEIIARNPLLKEPLRKLITDKCPET